MFHAVEEIEGGVNGKYGAVGFKATLLCDAPWGWEDGEAVYEAAEIGTQMAFENPSVYKAISTRRLFYKPERRAAASCCKT